MNRQQALAWLELCITSEELTEKKMMLWAEHKNLPDKDIVLEECEASLLIYNELRQYVRENLK